MGHSRAEKAEHHDKILALASRQLRAGGLDAINVSELMNAAGLTHGGFYRHFASRADLIAKALEQAFSDGASRAADAEPNRSRSSLAGFVRGYLSRSHRDAPAEGCAIAALAADIGRSNEDARRLLARHIASSAAAVAVSLNNPDETVATRTGLAVMSTLVGALVLARGVGDPRLSDQILQSARAFILEKESP